MENLLPAELIWLKYYSAAITVANEEGIIIYMNEKSAKTFEKYGGNKLIGSSLFECHPEPSKSKLKKLYIEQISNCYTIEKGEIKKLIHQSPWYKEEKFMGYVELSIEIPKEMQHFIRKP